MHPGDERGRRHRGGRQRDVVRQVEDEGAIRLAPAMSGHHLITVLPIGQAATAPQAFHFEVASGVVEASLGDLAGADLGVGRPGVKCFKSTRFVAQMIQWFTDILIV